VVKAKITSTQAILNKVYIMDLAIEVCDVKAIVT
jgi:hypothetical protein